MASTRLKTTRIGETSKPRLVEVNLLDFDSPPEVTLGESVKLDRFLALKRIRALALEIWGDENDAEAWLTSPHYELGGKSPESLMNTKAGVDRVENLLAALENGFPV